MAEKSNVLVRQVPQWMTKAPQMPWGEDLEKRLDDLERRHDRTRKLLVGALTVALVVLIGTAFQPGWVAAVMIGFFGCMFIEAIIEQWLLKDETRTHKHR